MQDQMTEQPTVAIIRCQETEDQMRYSVLRSVGPEDLEAAYSFIIREGPDQLLVPFGGLWCNYSAIPGIPSARVNKEKTRAANNELADKRGRNWHSLRMIRHFIQGERARAAIQMILSNYPEAHYGRQRGDQIVLGGELGNACIMENCHNI